eukprot:TRINITY_DN8270_c1_g1_i1.p1 TRINITY_DN8270_c1_g1~~TRINITY_DN8270_c1_g1_i1.p1  ORF type:complete len:487 (+),score=79.21 TRINITY_DN8270_c1_g1_i1:109-1569(+)
MATATEGSPLLQKEEQPPFLKATTRVFLITCVAALAEGYDLGIINGVIVRVTEDFELSTAEIMTLLGFPQMAAAVGALCSGTIGDAWGRKSSLNLSMVAIAVGSVIMALAEGFWNLLLGRLIILGGCGAGLSIVTTYLSEVAPAKTRGFYNSLTELCLNCGIVFAMVCSGLIVGMQDDWRLMVALGGVMPLFVMALLYLPGFVPESPRFLLLHNQPEEAKRALAELLDGDQEEVEETLWIWKNGEKEVAMTWDEALTAFRTTHRKSFLAGAGVGVMVFVSCQPVMSTVFSTTILISYGGMSHQEAMDNSVVISTVKLMSIVFACFYAVDMLGRRPLILFSCNVGAICFGLLSVVLSFNLPHFWLVVGLSAMSVGFSSGLGPVQYSYMSEVFETKLRAKGTSFCFLLSRMMNGVMSMFLAWGIREMTPSHMFRVICLMNLMCLVFAYSFCPETKLKTLEQLKAEFSSIHVEDTASANLDEKDHGKVA